MWLSDIKERILDTLIEEPLDQFQIAAELAEAAFRVRAELHDLRRDRLVREEWHRGALKWKLTDRAYSYLEQKNQTTLDELLRER